VSGSVGSPHSPLTVRQTHCDAPVIIRNWCIYVAQGQVGEKAMMHNGNAEFCVKGKAFCMDEAKDCSSCMIINIFSHDPSLLSAVKLTSLPLFFTQMLLFGLQCKPLLWAATDEICCVLNRSDDETAFVMNIICINRKS
jgi:hypothetical protein